MPVSTGGNSFLSAIDKTEGGGNYDTLFGHAQRDGGQFAGVKISEMPISDVLAFANPSGRYGQSVKGKVGHVATPMGRYQIVGSTLRAAAKEMGLDPNTPFAPHVQDSVATHIARKAIAGKDDATAINALRNTWEGFKSIPNSQMMAILSDLRSNGSPAAQVANTPVEAINMIAPQSPYPEQGQVAPHDFTGNQQLSSAAGLPFQQPQGNGLTPEQFNARFGGAPMQPQAMQQPDQMMTGAVQQAPQQQFSDSAMQQHDAMWGGALAPQGQAPQQTADTSGAFPPAPTGQPFAQRQQSNRMQEFARLISNPFVPDEQKKIAQMIMQQEMQQSDPMRQLDMDYKRAQIGALNAKSSGLADPAKVQTSVVLDDGTSVLVMNDGSRRVLSPTGEVIQGQSAADAIKSAREYTVSNQRDIYGARREGTLQSDIDLGGAAAAAQDIGKATVKTGMAAWDDYGKLQNSVANIDEAIGALDRGAEAGYITKMLPNITEASASLKNALDRMGLDVIGSVTFGALSEGEMRLAMDTAAPRDLSPQNLRIWLERKRDAQIKAADTLADAARYLTNPNNNINGWIEKNLAAKKGASQPSTGANINGYSIRKVQ